MLPSPFPVRAVVEGFYGVFYTPHERDDLLRFLARHGYNHYLYAPKDDWYHRLRWREPYPDDQFDALAASIATAQEEGITFCYAISPGLSICYSAPEEWERLTAKLFSFYEVGVRAFSLFLDDIPTALRCDDDQERYPTLAAAQAELANRLYAWLQGLDSACTLSFCPTAYHGSPPFDPSLYELGESLHPAIDIFYTGPEVCSATISVADVAAFAEVVRRPPLLWDNYPVNDSNMEPELHLGPLRGRDPALAGAVRGIAFNPMNQPAASRIPLATGAAFLAAPDAYDPERAWEVALRAAAGPEAFAPLSLFAENSLASPLGVPRPAPLALHARAATEALARGEPPARCEPLMALAAYLLTLEEAVYFLTVRLSDTALRNDLLPWLDVARRWVELGKRTQAALRAIEGGSPPSGSFG